MRIDHVSAVVPDLEEALLPYRVLGLPIGATEEFESEDSREAYVRTAPTSILLQQPRSPGGPLGRHLALHGAGFHHLALAVPDLPALLAGLPGSGWLATGSTFRNLARGGPAWLVRPGVQLTLEVMQDRPPDPGEGPFDRVAVTFPELALARRLFAGLGVTIPDPTLDGACDAWMTDFRIGRTGVRLAVPRGDAGPFARFLRARGPGFHHLMLRVPDLRRVGEDLRRAGVEMIPDAPIETPQRATWFVHPRDAGGWLLELGQPKG